MKTYCGEALKGKDIKTFAATCSKVGQWPKDVVFADPFDLVLVDEAAAAREPDIFQCLNIAQSGATFVQIGDHKQLRPVVHHPENKADNNDMSLFERLRETANLPCVRLRRQYRMPANITVTV